MFRRRRFRHREPAPAVTGVPVVPGTNGTAGRAVAARIVRIRAAPPGPAAQKRFEIWL